MECADLKMILYIHVNAFYSFIEYSPVNFFLPHPITIAKQTKQKLSGSHKAELETGSVRNEKVEDWWLVIQTFWGYSFFAVLFLKWFLSFTVRHAQKPV